MYRDTTSIVEKTSLNKKYEKIDEYVKFKNDLEVKVKLNEDLIKKLKDSNAGNSKLYRKINSLEFVNSQFLQKLNEYNEEVKKNRKLFEEKTNQDIIDLKAELKSLNSK